MDKPETEAALRQDTYGNTRDAGSIETIHRKDKPETQAVLNQDTEWTNQRHRQY
jgi:hypothetical protein